MTIRQGDDPAQAEKFIAMRTATREKRMADAVANPVVGARSYEAARDQVHRLMIHLMLTQRGAA